jgi:hypothetical protein
MRSFRTFLAVVVLGVAFTAIDVASASAVLVHKPISSFNGEATPAHVMEARGVAVDNSSSASAGDVYVSDYANSVVDKFSASGTYLSQLTETPSGPVGALYGQDAVNASGDVFVPEVSGHVDEFDPSGVYVAQIPIGHVVLGVAVNVAGEVFVASAGTVYKYDPVTSTVSTFATGFGGAYGVAVDDDPSSLAYGHVYVVDHAQGVVEAFDSSGTRLTQFTAPSGAYNAVVDPATGDLYVAGEHVVYEFSPTGAYIGKIPTSGEAWTSVAVNATSGDVYVSGNAGVEIFGPGVIVPDATTSPATGVQPTEVTLRGHVDPVGGGAVTSCLFEYGTSTTYGKTVPCSPATPYTVPTNVSATVGGLSGDTEYHYRLSVGNANGTNESEDGAFETTGPPTIGEQSVDKITQSTATLHAQLNAHGLDTHYRFEYGPTTSYGTSVPVPPGGDAGTGMTPVQVSAQATGLSLSTTYHYRLVAENGFGPAVEGPDGEFTSSPAAVVEGLPAIAGPNEARLRARVEAFGAPSDCEVEYVTDAQFVSSGYQAPTIAQCTPPHLPGVERQLHPIAEISGLAANTTYHYRYLISNKYGETRTADQTFITFGFTAFSFEARAFSAEAPGHLGGPETQAGAHPYVLDTNIALNTNSEAPAGTVKDIRVHLPAGLIGNPQAVAKCTRYDSERQECPADSEIGEITVYGIGTVGVAFSAPLFNVVPPRGVAAEFSARFSKLANAYIVGSVRTGSDYGIDADSLNITTVVPVRAVHVRIWGVPADPSHNEERRCPEGPGLAEYFQPPCEISAPLRPFLTNPTSCAGPMSASVQADTYQAPGEFAQLGTGMPAMTGCGRLPFAPTIEAQPTSSVADSPSGLHVDLHVPQPEGCSVVGGKAECELAEADLKDAKVVLPAGLAVDPSSAGGLQACSEAQVGYLAQRSAEVGRPQFTPGPAECPDSSKVGSVEVDTPLVGHPLPGAVYVAAQGANPFKSLLALYITVYDPESGVVVKLPGKVALDPVTGQLTTTVDENPQLPFNDFKLDFFSGSRGALTTPFTCGSYATSSDLTPWSTPEGKDATPSSLPFAVSGAPGGGACVSSEAQAPNSPGFTAGTASPVAGSYSPFVLKLTREDGSQRFGALNVTLAPGLTGKIAGIEQCPQAAIEKAQSRSHEGEGALEQSSPSCPSGSAVGVVHVGAGSGAPYYVTGKAYFAGPYNGAPFSLVIVTPALAGPFDLGTVVVRAGLFINPSTAQVTVKSDPFPSILDGIPLDIRSVAVEMNRSEFMLNPTNCAVMSVTGEEKSTTGNVASLSSRFQAGGCTTLPFSPSFTASTQGKASRADGASLVVKVNPLPGQANIAKVDLQLPKQLPSRLKTLQKACTEAQFNANPAGCPEGSAIGSAVARTPILNNPLVGPAYLVSHGGAAFPDVEFVLQGEGVEIVLDGGTQIKNGVTYARFETVPDAPISSFETVFPEGRHSVLGTNLPASAKYSLCGQNLTIPTTITAQNGAVVTQSTKIAVTGCPKVLKKALTRAQKLKAALKVCRAKDRGRSNAKRRKREGCERAAQRRYGPVRKTKKAHGKKK